MLIARFGSAGWLIELDHMSVPTYQSHTKGNGKYSVVACYTV